MHQPRNRAAKELQIWGLNIGSLAFLSWDRKYTLVKHIRKGGLPFPGLVGCPSLGLRWGQSSSGAPHASLSHPAWCSNTLSQDVLVRRREAGHKSLRLQWELGQGHGHGRPLCSPCQREQAGHGVLAVLLEDAIRLQCCLSSQGAGQPRCVFISNREKGWIFFFFSTAGNSWDSYIPGEMAEELGAKKHRRSGITQSICAAHSLQASGAACMVGQWVTVRTPSLASTSGTNSQRARIGWRQSCKLHAQAVKHSPLSFCWASLRGAWHHPPDSHPLDIDKYWSDPPSAFSM